MWKLKIIKETYPENRSSHFVMCTFLTVPLKRENKRDKIVLHSCSKITCLKINCPAF